jgi:hypothetical protein
MDSDIQITSSMGRLWSLASAGSNGLCSGRQCVLPHSRRRVWDVSSNPPSFPHRHRAQRRSLQAATPTCCSPTLSSSPIVKACRCSHHASAPAAAWELVFTWPPCMLTHSWRPLSMLGVSVQHGCWDGHSRFCQSNSCSCAPARPCRRRCRGRRCGAGPRRPAAPPRRPAAPAGWTPPPASTAPPARGNRLASQNKILTTYRPTRAPVHIPCIETVPPDRQIGIESQPGPDGSNATKAVVGRRVGCTVGSRPHLVDEAGGEAVGAAVALRLPCEDGRQRLGHQHIPLRQVT